MKDYKPESAEIWFAGWSTSSGIRIQMNKDGIEPGEAVLFEAKNKEDQTDW